MFISICAFSVMDVIVKWTDEYPVGQVLFFRGFCGLIPILFIIPKERYLDFYKTNRPWLHFKRCSAGVTALIAIIIALRNLPLATVVSITFAAPIFTTIFSIFLLNEKVGFYRWLAVMVGFIGILVRVCSMTQRKASSQRHHRTKPCLKGIRRFAWCTPIWWA